LYTIPKRTMFTISNTIFHTKTIICKPMVIGTSIRTMHKVSSNLKAQEAFYKCCLYFKNVPLRELKNDRMFMNHYNNLLREEPNLHARAFQLALEVCYHKRRYSENDLRQILDGRVSINDLAGFNNGQVDSSTLYTAFQTDLLTKRAPFNKSSVVIVNSTPINNINPNSLPPNLQSRIALSKTNTGNIYNDIDIDGHMYDYKYSDSPLYNKNHIYFYDYENYANEASILLKHLERVLKDKLENHLRSKILLSNDDVLYTKESYQKLILIKSKQITVREKMDEWNLYIQKTMHARPSTFTTPILVQTTDKPFIPSTELLEETKKVIIEHGHMQPDKALKAIKGIVKGFDNDTQEKAYIETNGVIGQMFSTNPDSSLEVD
jgi:hypothetical protein